MIIAVCGQKVGRQDALRTIPLSKVRRLLLRSHCGFRSHLYTLCCPSWKVSEGEEIDWPLHISTK